MNGTAVSVQPDDDDHCLREVQVLAGDVLWEVKLARDGAVLETEKVRRRRKLMPRPTILYAAIPAIRAELREMPEDH